MRARFSRQAGVLAAALGILLATHSQAAQPQLPPIEGVWQNISGIHLDRFSGAGDDDPLGRREFRPVNPPYNAEYAEKYRLVRESAARGKPLNDPTALCVWPGVPRVIWNPYPMEIVISRGGRQVHIIHEYMSQVRRVFADGRGHPEDLEPSYNGHTLGRWEGQTLVLDTVGLREDTMLQNTGMMHSDALRVQERWRLVADDLLEAEITMIDPKAFTAPYVTRRLYRRQPEWSIDDYVCAENNRERIVDGVTQQVIPGASAK